MVNSKKKMNKSTVAIVVLALLLVLSLVLTATGAWFTDKAGNENAGSLTFGKVDIEIDETKKFTLTGGSAEIDGHHVMPGDEITVSYTVNNLQEAVYVRSTITVTFDVSEYTDPDKVALDAAMLGSGESLTGWATAEAKSGVYTYTVKDGGNAYFELAAKTTEAAVSKDISATFTLPVTLTNAAMEQTITVGYIVEAVQKANNTPTPTFPSEFEEVTPA